MRERMFSNRGANIVEYTVLTVIILSALIVMKEPILHGVFARHKQAGESFAFGRQYDARRTTVCKQDVLSYNPDGSPNPGPWYNEDCYQARVRRPPVSGGDGVCSGPSVVCATKQTSVSCIAAVGCNWINSGWNAQQGGCPECYPGNAACFACEDIIKEQCHSYYCNY